MPTADREHLAHQRRCHALERFPPLGPVLAFQILSAIYPGGAKGIR